MSDAMERPGEDQLLDEILLGDGPDPERMARYAEDPAALGDAERAEIESYLASSPRARDELAVLRRFDATALSAAPARPVRRAPAHRSRFARSLRVGLPVLVAAAAVIAVLLVRPWRESSSVPGALTPQIARAPEPPRTEPRQDAPRTPSPEPRPTQPPVQPGASAAPPRAEPTPAPAPRAVESPPAQEEPVYVALLEPEYVASWDLERRPRVANQIRGPGDLPVLSALAPEHVARTLAARPTLLWHVSNVPATGEWRFAVTDPQAIDPLIQRPLLRPEHAGVQRVELDTDLDPGTEYQWAVVWRSDPKNPATDVIAQGWIRRIAEPAELRAEIASRPPAERAALYARAGLWYDAVAELDRVHRRFPDEPGPRSALERLLATAGLPELELAEW